MFHMDTIIVQLQVISTIMHPSMLITIRGVQYSVLDRIGPAHFDSVFGLGLFVIQSSVWTGRSNWLVFFVWTCWHSRA